MAAIHHATIKKAAKFSLTFKIDGGTFDVINPVGDVLASANDPKDALDLALVELGKAKGNSVSAVDVAAFKAADPAKRRAPKDGAKSKKRKAKARKKSGKNLEEDGEDEEEPETRSIVKSKYREKYRPHKMTNGDSIAKRVHAEFMTKKDEDTKKSRLDFDGFVKFAKANGCWVEGYRSLKNRHGERNNGLIRMNVINRLRAKVRAKEEIIWP